MTQGDSARGDCARLWPRALEALDQGNVAALSSLLDRCPELALATAMGDAPPYDGYFHGATLLHHVAGNPLRPGHHNGLPETIVEIAELLLERGAPVDATCGGGPSQPDSVGGTTLGLVASSARAERDGKSRALIDCLLKAGAVLDPGGDGGLLWTALYHTVENQGQREVAGYLVERGHPVDGCYSSGIGSVEEVAQYLVENEDGGRLPVPDADLFHRHRRPSATGEEVLCDMFLFACVQGNCETARFLWHQAFDCGRVASPLAVFRPWGPFPVTPLHGAAWAGFDEMVDWLLEIGAPVKQVEPTYNGTAEAWARHAGHLDVAQKLAAQKLPGMQT